MKLFKCERCGNTCYSADKSTVIIVPRRTRVVGYGQPYEINVCQKCMEDLYSTWLDGPLPPEFGGF